MRNFIAIIGVGIFTFLSCQAKRTSENSNVGNDSIQTDTTDFISADTLIIKDNDAAHDPFAFGDQPLSFLLSDKSLIPEVKTEDYQEEGDTIKRGTYYRLKYDNDYFSFYKRLDNAEFYTGSELLTTKFSTKSGVKIGMTKKEVLNFWKKYKIEAIPTVVIIGDEFMNSSIQFEFKNDRLIRIFYDPYFD
jgi:hypothetical protein